MERNAPWKPFSYEKQLVHANRMQIKKAEFSSRCSIKKWSKLTTFINELDSRQQEGPLLEEYINFSRCEPLKNNTKELFKKILQNVLVEWLTNTWFVCLVY